MRDPKAKEKIIILLKKRDLTDDYAMEVANIVLKTKEVQKLRAEMESLIENGYNLLSKYGKREKIDLLRNLLRLALSDL
jgi:hypothetical protein